MSFFCSYLVVCPPWVAASLGCLPASGECLLASGECLPASGACLPCLRGCRPALLAWVRARHAGARPPLNVSTTRGTVPLTMVTAQDDWNPVAAVWPLFIIESSPSGRISNGRRPTSARSSPSPCGTGRIGILREKSQVHEHQVGMARTWTPSEMTVDTRVPLPRVPACLPWVPACLPWVPA